VLANNVSGGLEPLFMTEYIRTSIQPYAPEGLAVPQNINWSEKTFDASAGENNWKWAKEGDENILITNFKGTVWKYDASRGLLKESSIKDYGVHMLQKADQWNQDADWAKTSFNLNINDHVNTMSVFSKYIDSAMSKTVN